MILKVQEGDTVNTIGTGDAAVTYTPEDAVLVSGVFGSNGTGQPENQTIVTGHCKRKFMIGDQLRFLVRADAGTSGLCFGTVTMFFKY